MAGQSLSTIRDLLAQAELAPRHRFGQNFLIDLNLMRKLVDAADLTPEDLVLEVGPGTGSLTEILLDRGARVIAVEIDHGLQTLLADLFHDNPRFHLIPADVLRRKHELNPDLLHELHCRSTRKPAQFKLVANLPYQVATPLLINLLCLQTPICSRLAITIQREVGQRLTAAPNTPAYGPISVVAQSLAEIREIATLPPHVFWPKPQVDSVMLDLRRCVAHELLNTDLAAFARFVQRSFQHRRKKIVSAFPDLAPSETNTMLAAAKVSPDQRPASLTPQAWRALHQAALIEKPPEYEGQ